MYMKLPNQTVKYCGPYGGVHTYRPWFVPEGVGLSRPPPRFRPFANVTRAVPVMRVEDDYPVPFFYWADGCSDTYIHVNSHTGMVAHDRIDAIQKMVPHATAVRTFVEHCKGPIQDAGLHLLPRAMMMKNAWVDIMPARSMITQTGCFNNILYTLMRRRGLHTLVLNYESPGGDTSGSMRTRKTEIIYLNATFYDGYGSACALKTLRNCYHCENSVVSRAVCNGSFTKTPSQSASRRPLTSSKVARTAWESQ